MTQKQLILEYLQTNGSITPRDAMEQFGCMRLGARIYDLKREGHDIRKAMEARPNRFGVETRYARYFIP